MGDNFWSGVSHGIVCTTSNLMQLYDTAERVLHGTYFGWA
jgi:hypothetical protein